MSSSVGASISTSTALEQWAHIVDSIHQNTSLAPLPDHYDPRELLPFSATENENTSNSSALLTNELAEALLQHINETVLPSRKDSDNGAKDGTYDKRINVFEEEASKIFQPQFTLLESLHAMPSVPHFSSLAVDGSNPLLDSSTLPSVFDESTSKAKSSPRAMTSEEFLNKVLPLEGPNFLKTYSEPEADQNEERKANASSSARHHRRRLEQATSTTHSTSAPRRRKTQGQGSLPPMRMSISSRLTSGFVNPDFYAAVHLKPDFMPVILAPSTVTAPLQLVNVKRFLEEGCYVDPSSYFIDQETGAASIRRVKPERVVVSSAAFKRNLFTKVSFKEFRVVDDPGLVENWDHVCAAIVTGKEYQFESWFPQEHRSICLPSHLFQRIAGFLPYFEEDPIPVGVQQWNVKPLLLTKRMLKEQQHIRETARFWEILFQFLDYCPYFNKYTEE